MIRLYLAFVGERLQTAGTYSEKAKASFTVRLSTFYRRTSYTLSYNELHNKWIWQSSLGPFAEMKRKELLLQLHKLGAATYADYEALIEYDETTEEVAEAALRKSPNSVLFWDRLLSAKVEPVLERADELSKDSEEVVKAKQLCDEALEKVCSISYAK